MAHCVLGQGSLADALVSPKAGSNARLERIAALLDLSGFAALLSDLHAEPTGRPSWPSLLMFRCLLLQQWYGLTERDFAEMLGLGQVLPGSNMTNAAVMVGDHFRGVPGAIAAVAGLLVPPLAVLVGIALLYARFGEFTSVCTAVAGMAAAAAGMIIGTALKMAQKLKPTRGALLVGLLAFAAVGVARLPLLLVVLALAPLGIAIAWREEHAR